MKKKDEKLPVEISEEEKVVSLKRVVIASMVCIALFGAIIWGITWISEYIVTAGKDILVSQNTDVPDTVRLPQRGDADIVVTHAKEYISDISFEYLMSSQSGIQNIIDRLQEIQSSDTGIEDFICSLMCN